MRFGIRARVTFGPTERRLLAANSSLIAPSRRCVSCARGLRERLCQARNLLRDTSMTWHNRVTGYCAFSASMMGCLASTVWQGRPSPFWMSRSCVTRAARAVDDVPLSSQSPRRQVPGKGLHALGALSCFFQRLMIPTIIPSRRSTSTAVLPSSVAMRIASKLNSRSAFPCHEKHLLHENQPSCLEVATPVRKHHS